jgi:hypothetical protein
VPLSVTASQQVERNPCSFDKGMIHVGNSPENAISGKASKSRSFGFAFSRIASARLILLSTSPTRGANCKQAILISVLKRKQQLSSDSGQRKCPLNVERNVS